MISVLVGDAHPLYRVALVDTLAGDPGFAVAAAVGDGWSALAEARALRPDVVCLDAQMPGLDGPAVAEELIHADPRARVLFLSGSSAPQVAERCIATGARGYLGKHATEAEIKAAIGAIHAGKTVAPRPAPCARGGSLTKVERLLLTDRERTVLEHVSRGLTVNQIAAAMFLSPATIKTHLQSVYLKLGVNERAGAVGEAMRRRILI